MRIVFMGSPDFAATILSALISHHDVLAVYTQPDRPSGRGLTPAASAVKKLAAEQGIKVLQPKSLKSPEEASLLRDLKPEAIVVAAYGLLLPRAVLDIPPTGCINVHPSLLPLHRGASPVTAAILAGDAVTGVTIMLLDEGWDTGPILAQASLTIAPADTTGTLTSKLAELGAHLLLDTLPLWQRKDIARRPQDSTMATYSQTLRKEEGELDWRLMAAELERRVRAFLPWPGCYTRWRGKLLKVLKAHIASGRAEPGRVVGLEGGAVAVGTGQDMLALEIVQLEGKKAMSIQEFLRGRRDFVGALLQNVR